MQTTMNNWKRENIKSMESEKWKHGNMKTMETGTNDMDKITHYKRQRTNFIRIKRNNKIEQQKCGTKSSNMDSLDSMNTKPGEMKSEVQE